ncbi:MAG: tetratricopeptide repeat protein [Bdellovibrionales bacterium]|nr:tetratricopeptide repeat protein [Bdellovibrionales bacterium]
MKRFTSRALAPLLLFFSACSVGVAEKDWQLAEEFETHGQYLRAIEEYSRIVNLGHRDALAIRAQMRIAEIYNRNLKDYPRAIRAYRDAYRRSDDRRMKMDARWAIATIYNDRLQNSAAAAEEYKPLYEEFGQYQKDGEEILLAWAKSLNDSGRFKESAEKYVEFRKRYPGHKEGPRTLLEEGHAHLADREPELAVKCFRELISTFGGQDGYRSMVAEAYFGLGSAFESMDELSPALEAYRQSLATYPNPKVIQLKIERVEKRKRERRI